MTQRWAWFIIAPVALVVALATVFVARHEGTSTGTPEDLSALLKKDCPSGPPDECRELIASLLHVDLRTVPTFAPTIDGLKLRSGYVLIDRTGFEPPTALFEY